MSQRALGFTSMADFSQPLIPFEGSHETRYIECNRPMRVIQNVFVDKTPLINAFLEHPIHSLGISSVWQSIDLVPLKNLETKTPGN